MVCGEVLFQGGAMRAFVVAEFGQPGAVREVPDPRPEPNQVLVRVRAAGVNPADWAMVNGVFAQYGVEHHFPLVPGSDLAGEVAEAPGGEGPKPGEEVFGGVSKAVMGEGSWAELVVVGSEDVAPKPASLDDVAAAGVATAGLTALEAVDAAGLERGGVLLLVGATGGVGSYATQLAALRGIRVLAVSRGENAAYARDLGAVETIDYTQGELLELARTACAGGVDAVIDLASDRETVQRLSELVRAGGAVVSVRGAVDLEATERQGKRGVNAMRAPLNRLAELVTLFEGGRLRPPPTKAYPLERAQEAIDQVATGHVRGKLAVTVA
jgi:NADPH:quinone reductase-like Zn-dependent oxidoreductase